MAYFLQMTSAIDLIVEFLTRKMNFDNADAILEMADDYAIQKLKDHYRILILENFFDFAETNSFLKLSATQLKDILENDSLKTSTESRLLKCAIRLVATKKERGLRLRWRVVKLVCVLECTLSRLAFMNTASVLSSVTRSYRDARTHLKRHGEIPLQRLRQ